MTIQFNGQDSVRVGTASEARGYYKAVIAALQAGEMDTVIGNMLETRAVKLRGRKPGGRKKKLPQNQEAAE